MFQILIIAIVALLWVVPAWRILKRLGYAGEWALLAIIPMIGLIGMWVIAFSEWPNERQDPAGPA